MAHIGGHYTGVAPRSHTMTPGRSYVELKSRIPQISKELLPKVSAAVKVGAELVAASAKERAPVRTGALKDAIHVAHQGHADWKVIAGDGGDVFYGHMVELGTTRAAAHPFLIPALEENRRNVEKAVKVALSHL